MTATGIAILAIVIVLALAIGLVLRRRSGRIRPAKAARPAPSPAGSSPTPSSPAGPSSDHEDPTELQLLRNAGLADDGPSVVHFSADWCGPCAAVRRVVTDVVTRLNAEGGPAAPAHDLELDLDANPELAQGLRVMSLPTTFVYDSSGRAHGRIAGVPSAAELAETLRGLREPN